MWKLTINPNLEKEYCAKFEENLVRRIRNGKTQLKKDICRLLIDDDDYDNKKHTNLSKIHILLVGEPDVAYKLNQELMPKIIPEYNDCDHSTVKNPTMKIIKKIFNYEGVLSQNKENSYWLSNQIGHNTCTYCNIQYTFTIDSIKKGEHIVRPQFDHWFSKEMYPLLSLNLYNLIPSCSVCNSSLKWRKIFHLDTHIHPYTQETYDPKFKFIPNINEKNDGNWTIILDREKNSKEDNTIKAFHLDDMYKVHDELELKDIMDFATGYTDNYLHNLFEKVLSDYSSKGYSKEDVFRMLFGTEYMYERTLDRPLSKMKRDILKYLNII